MPLYQVQISLQGRSGLPTDQYVNNWHFEDIGPPTDAFGALIDHVVGWYDNLAPGALAEVRTFLSNVVQQGGHRAKVYRLDDPKPRVPLADQEFGFAAAPAGGALPTEVAVTLSFRAALTSGVNMARRRGRIYFGPVAGASSEADANNNPFPAVGLRDAMLRSAEEMAVSARVDGYEWVVHSPTTGALARFPVVHAWVDDTFDTVRARGREETARSERAIPVAP